MFLAISHNVFVIIKIVMFFVATIFIFDAMQAIDFSKIFRKDSGSQIRFLFMVIAIILGYLFVDAIINILESVNNFF